MPAKFPKALDAPVIPNAALPPPLAPDVAAEALSEGFKAALGRKPAGFHESSRPGSAAELARLAKSTPSDRPGKVPAGRQSHIGPRSGHK